MPIYKVLKPGFHNDRLYTPNGKRPELFSDNVLKPCPAWLKLTSAEAPAAKRKRTKKEAEADAKAQKKYREDQEAIQEAAFRGGGEHSNSVETL